jgi:glycosyltransferase involved in cell wall biosynthesis
MKSDKEPSVSVLLPVYNGEKTIARAIESILNQDFKDFELIILDDGSKDKTLDICKDYQKKDSRIILVHHENKGLSATLNIGLSLARGELIARQDSDDYSLPGRLQSQFERFKQDPDLIILGMWARIYTNEIDSGFLHCHPTTDKSIRLFLYFGNPFVHSSVMFRKKIIDQTGLYSSRVESQPEDYDLWIRMAQYGSMKNLPEIGLIYSETLGSLSRKSIDPFPYIHKITARYLETRIGLSRELCLSWAKAIHFNSFEISFYELLKCVFLICWFEKRITYQFLKRVLRVVKKKYWNPRKLGLVK